MRNKAIAQCYLHDESCSGNPRAKQHYAILLFNTFKMGDKCVVLICLKDTMESQFQMTRVHCYFHLNVKMVASVEKKGMTVYRI